MSKYGLDDFLFNIFCNLFSTALLAYALIAAFTPKIKISPFIALRQNEDERVYSFKFINQTFLSFNDVRISLYIKRYYESSSLNQIVRIEPLKLSIDTLKYLPKRRFFSRLASNAIIIRTDHNIEAILLEPNCTIEFSIDLTHPVNPFNFATAPRKVFVMEFATVEAIKTGKFKFGNNLSTI